MRTKILAIMLLLTGIAGVFDHYQESRKIGPIVGSIAPATFIEKSFARAVAKRFDVEIAKLVFMGQEIRIVQRVEILSGGAVDATYYAPSIQEVGRLIKMAKNNMTYVPEVYDCDDYSRHFKDVLLRQWAKEGNLRPLPIFEVYAAIYIPQTKEVLYHAFNAIVTNEGKVVFIEPQGPRPIAFSTARILKIYFAGV